MNFVKIPTTSGTGTAFINAQHVSLVAKPDDQDVSLIYLAVKPKSPDSSFRSIATTAPLETILRAFGPFVRVKKFQPITGNPWNVYYLRLAAIVSVWPLGDGRADVTMNDGRELMIEDDEVLRSAGVEIISL
ncbi:hypothetical protein PWP93_36625 [Paraburkholderia sp. A1RI-2L]|uniref:hypothetical protein n=1 Tax=Paraburkholderia sp. A1RI-2L TaxID=3028367 RepID=UPI003B7ACD9D